MQGPLYKTVVELEQYVRRDDEQGGEFDDETECSAAVAGIASESVPDEQVEEIHDDGRGKEQPLPVDARVHYIYVNSHGNESLNGQTDACGDVELTVDYAIFGRLLVAGIGHHLDELCREHLGIGVGHGDGEGGMQR